jgi:hypothetical protein
VKKEKEYQISTVDLHYLRSSLAYSIESEIEIADSCTIRGEDPRKKEDKECVDFSIDLIKKWLRLLFKLNGKDSKAVLAEIKKIHTVKETRNFYTTFHGWEWR